VRAFACVCVRLRAWVRVRVRVRACVRACGDAWYQQQVVPWQEVVVGRIEHITGSVQLLKMATDLRDAKDFIRNSTLLNGTLVTVEDSATTESATKYLLVRTVSADEQRGWVKADYVSMDVGMD
jgi:hypothetical protein